MKKKKLMILFAVFALVVIFSMMIIAFISPTDYELIYELNGHEIREIFDKDNRDYQFTITYENFEASMLIEAPYTKKRKLIDDISIIEEDGDFCIIMTSSDVEIYPLCYENGHQVDYNLSNLADDDFYTRPMLEPIEQKTAGISLKTSPDRNYFVWNYRGYHLLSANRIEEIDFLEKESYYNNLAYATEDWLVTPNYDQNYAFTEMYAIDMKTGKVSTWKLNLEISFNSYYLGDVDGRIYLVDRKNKAEYELDPKKKKITRIDSSGTGKVYDGSWNDLSMTKLSTDDYVFEKNLTYRYTLEDSSLYLSFRNIKEKMLVSSQKIDKIISARSDKIYYLVGDELYYYSLKYGENLVLSYSELKFNPLNSIFIY